MPSDSRWSWVGKDFKYTYVLFCNSSLNGVHPKIRGRDYHTTCKLVLVNQDGSGAVVIHTCACIQYHLHAHAGVKDCMGTSPPCTYARSIA